jgi:hypothetical protein
VTGPREPDPSGEGADENIPRRPRPRRSRPKENPPTSGVRRRRVVARRPDPGARPRVEPPPPAPELPPPGRRGAVIPLRSVARGDRPSDDPARSRPGPLTQPEPPSAESRPPEREPVAEAPVAPVAAGPVTRSRRSRGGLRGTLGPERVAGILVVLLIAVAVPVALGVSLPNRGRQPATPTVPIVTASPPSPSASASGGGPAPSASAFSAADTNRINNLLTLHGILFEDGQGIDAELARSDGGRSQTLYVLLSEPLGHANTASQRPRPSSLGELVNQLGVAYESIQEAARIGRDAASTNREAQIESARGVVAAIGALRELDGRLRAFVGRPAASESASPAPSAS